MSNLIKYSGIVTKVRAMSQRLLTDEQYETLICLTSVPDALAFLKTTKGYRDSFDEVYERDDHRGPIERKLMNSLYTDFIKLYCFSDMAQRKFLDTYFLHYEILILKRCLRNVMNHDSLDVRLGTLEDFFHHHSRLSIDALNRADTLPEFMEAIAGTSYEKLLRPVYESNASLLWDYETTLDLYYFSTVWKQQKKLLSKEELEQVSTVWGTRIDLLNLQWIYRSRKYFHMKDMDIYPLLIPIHYRLRPAQIQALANASDMEGFLRILRTTHYGKYDFSGEQDRLLNISTQLLNHIYDLQYKKEPYSMAAITRYLYLKEKEVHCLICVIEGIRYRLPADEIRRYIR